MMTPKERIAEFFSDALCEAEECIKQAELTPDEVVEAFADALTEGHSYLQSSADIYEKLINAVISRYRNK
jgi:hypothetical protein